jgi:DHA2 family multidrug resistance protein
MGQAILLATFPRPLHALVMMIWGVGSVAGPVTGPIVGSIISETYTWRGAFFLIVPPGLIAMIFVWLSLSSHTERRPAQFDWTGFIALSVAIASAQLILDRGQRLDWFESTEILIELGIALIALYVFIVHALTAAHPFLDPRLLLNRNFAIGLLLSFVMGMLSFTPMVLFPILLHDLRGFPDSLVGLLLAARGVGNWLSFLIVVPFTRRNPRLAVSCGLACQAIAGFAMAQLDINLTTFDVFWTNVLQGFGFGLAFTPMSVLAFATLPPARMTEGTGIFHLVRSFGSSIFISASVVVLLRTTAANYAGMTEVISPFNKILDYPSLIGLWATHTPEGLMVLADEMQRQAAMIGFINAFYLFAVTAAAAVPLAWLLRDVPRHG